MGGDSTTDSTFAEGVTLPTRGENAIPHLLAAFHSLNPPPLRPSLGALLSKVSYPQFPSSPLHLEVKYIRMGLTGP